jgi:hypothetical protein
MLAIFNNRLHQLSGDGQQPGAGAMRAMKAVARTG